MSDSMQYARFIVALERLCKKHRVQISQTYEPCFEPRICVESLSDGELPDMDIEDCTGYEEEEEEDEKQ